MSEKRKYDSTVARIAGNIASGIAGRLLDPVLFINLDEETVARECVSLARAIVAETERTEPSASTKDHP